MAIIRTYYKSVMTDHGPFILTIIETDGTPSSSSVTYRLPANFEFISSYPMTIDPDDKSCHGFGYNPTNTSIVVGNFIGKSGTLYPIYAAHISSTYTPGQFSVACPLTVVSPPANAYINSGIAYTNRWWGNITVIVTFRDYPGYYGIHHMNINNNYNNWNPVSMTHATDSSCGVIIASRNTEISFNVRGDMQYYALSDILGNEYVPPGPSDDPYEEIPESEPGGGGTEPDFTSSDVVDYPVMPSLSAVSTGFISLWAPTEDQMLDLSSFMWNANPLTIEFWKKLLADPMDMIYGLNIIPLELETAGVDTVTVGLISTGIEMNILASQWVELDCGYIDLDETWGAYLDYDPFTKLEIYLPYCGTHPLKVDDFMPGRISLMYHIDVLTGSCVALIKSTKTDKHGDVVDSVMYQFMGNCATQIPVTAAQYADAVRSVISLAASVGSLIAGPGAGAAMTSTTSNFERGPKGRMRLQSKTVTEKTSSPRDDGASVGSSTIDAVMGMKPGIERSGAIGASGGLLSVQTPYLILTRPRQARPANQNKYTGYPSFITENLGDLEGLTIVKAIHMNNMSCTTEELSEIEDLLRNGVIF